MIENIMYGKSEYQCLFVKPWNKQTRCSTDNHIRTYLSGRAETFEKAYVRPSETKRSVYNKWKDFANHNSCKVPLCTTNNCQFFTLVFEDKNNYFVITYSTNYIVPKKSYGNNNSRL